MDAGRFERLEEPGRQADRDAIADPVPPPLARGEPQLPGIGEGRGFELCQHRLLRCVIRDEGARIDDAVSRAVLQRNAPGPAGVERGRAGKGHDRPGIGARHGDGAVAWQPMGPVLIPGLQRLLDQQPAKAGAIDEQVGGDMLAILQGHGFDEPGAGVDRGVDDLSLYPCSPRVPRQRREDRRHRDLHRTDRRRNRSRRGRRGHPPDARTGPCARPAQAGRMHRRRASTSPVRRIRAQ